MADASILLESVNLFGLGANFEPQQTTVKNASELPRAFSEEGLTVASSRLAANIQYVQAYKYCGTDLSTDLGTTATAFGGVFNATSLGYGYITTNVITIKYSAMGYPEIILQGHNHVDLPHTSAVNTKDITSAIPASGFGVPDFGVTLGANASPVAAVLVITKGHSDVQDADGTHIHGANTKQTKLDLQMGFAGIPTSNTEALLEADLASITGFDTLIPSTSELKTNSKFTSFAFVAEGFGTT